MITIKSLVNIRVAWEIAIKLNSSEERQLELVNNMRNYESIRGIDVGEYITSKRAREIYYKNRVIYEIMK